MYPTGKNDGTWFVVGMTLLVLLSFLTGGATDMPTIAVMAVVWASLMVMFWIISIVTVEKIEKRAAKDHQTQTKYLTGIFFTIIIAIYTSLIVSLFVLMFFGSTNK